MIRSLAFSLFIATGLAKAATPIEETRPIDADGTVRVENLKGSITIETSDQAEVHLTGSLGDGVKALKIEGQGKQVRIRVEYPDSGWWPANKAEPSDLVIRVPRTASLDLEGVSADITVRDSAGKAVRIETVSGRIQAKGKAEEVSVESVSGAVQLAYDSPQIKAHTVSGSLSIDEGAHSRIELKSVSGGVRLVAGKVERLRFETVSGDVRAEIRALASGARIDGETLSGNITVLLPQDASTDLAIETFSGDIRAPAGEVQRERYGPGAKLDTRLGGGDGRMRLESFSGTVRVELR